MKQYFLSLLAIFHLFAAPLAAVEAEDYIESTITEARAPRPSLGNGGGGGAGPAVHLPDLTGLISNVVHSILATTPSSSSSSSSSGNVTGPSSSTTNAVARFADTTGKLLKNSSVLVDDAGNVTLVGITKNGNTVSWPLIVGAAGTFLGSDGAGNLIYAIPAGGGNVSTALPFTTNNAILTVDTPSSPDNIKQSGVTLDSSNNISGVNTLNANTINAPVINGTVTSAVNFTGPLTGDVTGHQSATVVSFVGGQSAANVAAGVIAANAATNTNTPNTIVERDSSGNFNAGTISANLIGNVTGNLSGNATSATTAGSATNFTGPLLGDVTGNQSSTVVSTVGGQTATNVAAATIAANAATNTNSPSTIVKRDASGNFTAGTITANLSGNATTATTATSATTAGSATNFTGSLAGDVTGTQPATVVSFVDGQSAANVAAATVTVDAATALNTPNTLVERDSSGNFAAGTITANLAGNATTATTAVSTTNFTGPLVGDVTGNQNSTVVSFVGGQSAANVASGVIAANAATNTNTPNTIVERDASGNFNAGTITANLIGNVTGNLSGNATSATTAGSATNFTGPLSGDVTGNQNSTVVSTVGGQTAANVAAATLLANNATNNNTASTIVRRDGSGNFSAATVTANLTGNVTGNVVGNVTGNLSGNATTATSATTAGSATNFTGPLAGDVTGTQPATVVSFVGGQSAANVASGVSLANTATNIDMPGTIVLRDASGDFITNMITIDGTTTNPTDVATKAYVDSVAALGIVAHTPALVVSTTDVALSSLQTIDSISLSAGDRVLLVGQTNEIQNGLWVAETGSWMRPTDFLTGTSAGSAYVLTLSGAINGGSSWLCNTPSALIDTNTITFAEFSLPSQTTGANVGTGAGQVYQGTVGVTLNFKTILAGTHMVVTNDPNDVMLSTDATNANTPSTIVARDSSGNFNAGTITANLTGAASQNVLKAGDTMTGNLAMALQSQVQFQDGTGSGNYVGLNAPATVDTSYTVNLPASAPTAGQVLQATSPSATQWNTVGGSPTAARTYYVSLAGNDSNDGSYAYPFRTISYGVTVANGVASMANPVVIYVGAGTFVENNTGGPILVTADGISLVGSSETSTIVIPASLITNLFSIVSANFECTNLTVESLLVSSADAFSLTPTYFGRSRFTSVAVAQFANAFAVSSIAGVPVVTFDNVQGGGNSTNISISNIQVVIQNSVFQGPLGAGAISNAGIIMTGTNTQVAIIGSLLRSFQNAIEVTNGANARILACDIDLSVTSIVCNNASILGIVGCNFYGNNSSSVNIAASGANTQVTIDGCQFNCTGTDGNPRGIALQATTGASLLAVGCSVENAAVGIQCGAPGDTSSTALQANSTTLINCTTDIQQAGSSTLQFFGGAFDPTKLSIASGVNVGFAGFDETIQGNLTLGSDIQEVHILYQVLNGQTSKPNLAYNDNYYGNQGTVYTDPNSDPTFNATQASNNDANYYVVTGNRTNQASINLISDTSGLNNGTDIRGWGINKVGTSADLAFTYTNNDTSGQAAVGSYSVMQLDGLNNQVLFPLATNAPLPTNTVAPLVWAGDTNIYRSSAGVLTTDGNFQVGGLTPAGVVHNDNLGNLTTSLIVNADISASAGITDDKLATISTPGKVANSATTATSSNVPNTIVLRDLTGSFSANIITATLVGAASLDVLKTGDTMTGNLNMALQSQVRFQDGTGSGNYVGLNAPATVGTSYTVNLPASAPVAGQVLQATSPSATQWNTIGGSPTTARTYYVSLAGNDSNDGSYAYPFRTISKAVTIANGVASMTNPVVIYVGAGTFVENNTGGPITITADGISLVGSSETSTIVIPASLITNLFSIVSANFECTNLTVESFSLSSADAFSLTPTYFGRSRFNSVAVAQFANAFAVSSIAGVPVVAFDNVQCGGNTTNISISNIQVAVQNSVFQGPLGAGAISNAGIIMTGTNTQVAIIGSILRSFDVAIEITNGANAHVLSCDIDSSVTGILCTNASNLGIVGCNFANNIASSVNIAASGASTQVTIDACQFHCTDTNGNPQGIALQATTGAFLLAVACSIENAAVGMQCGAVGDTNSTEIQANSTSFYDCITDIQQIGSSTLRFVGGVFDSDLLSIANATNVSFAGFDTDNNNALTIGNDADMNQLLFQVFNGQLDLPSLNYQSDCYSNKGTLYIDPNSDPAFTGIESQSNASHYVITTDRTKDASINLLSDTSGSVGSGANIRGWAIDKFGTSANLAFTYTNNDTSGQAARGSNSVMQLDGFNNQVLFPLATNAPLPTNTVAPLVWASDTNIYRSSAGVLTTDGNFQVGGLTPAGVVHNDNVGNLTTSLIVNADISASAGITDNKLATISTAGKVANSATTATSSNVPNTIVLRDGSGNFTTNMITIDGTTTNPTDVATKSYVDSTASTGLIVKSPALVVSTSNVALSGLQTIDGVTLVSSNTVLLVGQTNAVQNGLWLAESGSWIRPTDFLTGTSAGNAYVLILEGTVNAGSSWVCSTPSAIIDTNPIEFSEFSLPSQTTGANVGSGAGQIFQGKTGVTLNFKTISAGTDIIVTNNTSDVNIATNATNANTPSTIVARDASGNFSATTITANLSGNASTATNFTGALSGDVTGNQSATVVSMVGGQTATNVASATIAANAATNTNTPNTIVERDGSGNFNAGTITANLTGNVTGNLSGNATTATTAGSATNFTGSLSGDVTGNQSSTVVSTVGGQTAANVASATVAANAATSSNTPSTIVKRDASGNFAAGTITANLSGNATTATSATTATTAGSATNFTGSLAGDVTGTQGATVVSFVGGQSAASVALAASLVATATSNNIANTLVKRDASGNFAAGTITATLNGNASTATTATNFSGSLSGDVTGNQSATVVSTVGGQTAVNVASATVAANAATNTNTASTIVKRDASGNFSAGTITANLTGNVTGNLSGNATTATTAGSATNFTGSLTGDVTGSQSATVVSTVGGQTAANVAAATILANNATSSNTPSTIVRRDASGNFIAGTITAALTGAASLNLLLTGGTLTGPLTLPAGTIASPSLQFSGSTDLGITSSATNFLSMITSGSARLIIDSTGSVTHKSNYKMYAYLSANQGVNNTTANVIFNTVLFDSNSNYNATTGTYTVPVTGVYMINVTVTALTATMPSTQKVNIAVNGTSVTGASVSQILSTNNDQLPMTTCVLLSLTAGQLVTVSFNTAKNDTIISGDTHMAIHFMSF